MINRNMKYCLLIIALLGSIILATSANTLPDWRFIVGWTHPTIRAYVSDKTIKKVDGGLASALFLFVTTDSRLVELDVQKFHAKSFATMIVIDCNNRLMTPIVDFYFDKSWPEDKDIPIATRQYEPVTDVKAYIQVPRSSLIYTTLCASYI